MELWPTCCNISWWHVICCQFLANVGDMQISLLNELHLQHVMTYNALSSTLLGDIFCHLFLLLVVTWQKSMLTWHHIHYVGNMSWNVTCCWCYWHPACYGDIRQFQLRYNYQLIQIQFSIEKMHITEPCSNEIINSITQKLN